MEAITIKSSEEFNGVTTVFLSNGHSVYFATTELVLFIEDNHMNIEGEAGEEREFCTADEYLDNNWDAVVSTYYKNTY